VSGRVIVHPEVRTTIRAVGVKFAENGMITPINAKVEKLHLNFKFTSHF